MKNNSKLAVFSLFVFGARSYLAGSLHAQQSNPSQQTEQGQYSHATSASADESFAREAASGGMAEVKLGQLAQQKGTTPAVKQFGVRMETDHTMAGEKLKKVAAANNITLPSDMNKKDRE